MFTGIVQATGQIAQMAAQGDGMRMSIDARTLDLSDVRLGDSIAVDGCCLTVVACDAPRARLAFDVSGETLRCTAGFAAGRAVNLEKALRLADRLGGHLVTGHVDGVGIVHAFAPVAAGPDASWRLEIDAPATLERFIAVKGSIAVQGVSLTVNGVHASRFDVNLIPHTLAVTTLCDLRPGARVNLEIDVMARYVQRMLETQRSNR